METEENIQQPSQGHEQFSLKKNIDAINENSKMLKKALASGTPLNIGLKPNNFEQQVRPGALDGLKPMINTFPRGL